MNGIGRLVRRGLSHQRIHSSEARRHFISPSSSPTMSFLSCSGLASLTKFTSSISNSPFGKCGFLDGGQKRGLKALCKFKGKSAGRNSQGRITIFHRGGGAKRLQRRIDMKRSTASMGVVERVEYDPNRSARIALVRWTAEMQTPRKKNTDSAEGFTPLSKTVDPTTSDLRGVFSFSTLPGMRKFDEQTKNTQTKDVFLSSFSSKKGGEITPLPLPRIAIAGANPAFLASRVIEKLGGKDGSVLCEVQKCRPSNSVVWAHKMKRKAAISWHSSKQKLAYGNFTRQKTVAAKKSAF